MKHTPRLPEFGRKEKWRKVVEPCGARQTAPHVEQILAQYAWSADEMHEVSPVDFRTLGASKHPKYLLSFFQPNDVIWCGETYEMRAENFRTRDGWLSLKIPVGPFTCPSTFTPGVLKDSDYRVTKMRFGKTKDSSGTAVIDKTTIIYNECITIRNIPLEAYDYVVNGKPALEWVMERQAVTTDKDSGIVNDANPWATETMGIRSIPWNCF